MSAKPPGFVCFSIQGQLLCALQCLVMVILEVWGYISSLALPNSLMSAFVWEGCAGAGGSPSCSCALDAAGALSCVLTSVCFRCCTTKTERCEGSCKGCASSCRRAGLREGCQQQVTCRRAQCPTSQQEQHSLWIQVSVGVWGGLLCLNCCRQFWYWAAVGGKKEKMGGGEEGDGERRLS